MNLKSEYVEEYIFLWSRATQQNAKKNLNLKCIYDFKYLYLNKEEHYIFFLYNYMLKHIRFYSWRLLK